MAIQNMAPIIEYQAWIKKFSEYNEDILIQKLREIDELLWEKRKKLFKSLENGEISKIIFCKLNSEIIRFEKNNFVNNLRLVVFMDYPNKIDELSNKNNK